MNKTAQCIIKAAQLRAQADKLEKVAELTENNRRNNAATLLNFGLGAGALGGGAYGAHRLLQNIRAKEQMSALNSGRGLPGKGALGKGALGGGTLGISRLWRSPEVVSGSEVLNAELLKASNGGALKTVGKGIKTVYNLAATAGETLAAKRKLAKLALILGIGAGSVGAGVYGMNKLVGGLNNNLETLRNNLSIRGLLGGVREGISNKRSPSRNIVDSAAKTSKSSTVSRGAGSGASIRGLLNDVLEGASNKSSHSENIVDSVTNLGKSSTVSRGAGEVLSEVDLSQLSPQLRKQKRLAEKQKRLAGKLRKLFGPLLKG